MKHRHSTQANYNDDHARGTHDEVVAKMRRLCGSSEITTRSLMLIHMAVDSGIDAPLEALHRFADLIRADQLSHGFELWNNFKGHEMSVLKLENV